jgi:hypothetical protein
MDFVESDPFSPVVKTCKNVAKMAGATQGFKTEAENFSAEDSGRKMQAKRKEGI